uniref:Synaptonemal complex protein 1 n=1 Tax=Gongylonema pulchrum TaxID=637853 RepID=A0A183ED73_9BILA
LENAYRQTKFASNRAERVLVKEIDKLKRNQTKLAKYNIVKEEKQAIQLQLRGMNEKRSNVLKSIREITNQLQETDDELRYQRRNFQQLKERLRDLYQMKKELVESYNEERKEYKDWCTAKRNSGSFSLHPVDYGYPATYPSAHRSQAYDSAEEYPESFVTLRASLSLPARTADNDENTDKETSFVNVLKKKVSKKSTKKPCQKISHPVQMICLFKETGVPIPLTYREIEQTLKTVEELRQQYQEQTNIIVWEESDYQQLPSFSESTHTTDSAWNGSTDMSERGSTYGFMHVSSSTDFTSPVDEEPELLPPSTANDDGVAENLAGLALADEGIGSKSSTH